MSWKMEITKSGIITEDKIWTIGKIMKDGYVHFEDGIGFLPEQLEQLVKLLKNKYNEK